MKIFLLAFMVLFLSAGPGFSGDFMDILKQAKQGNADAQCNLGVMYQTGKGVSKDYKQAVYWFRKAAEQGHPEGQYELGQMYYWGFGSGGNMDCKKAIYWWEKAEEQGHVEALLALIFQCRK